MLIGRATGYSGTRMYVENVHGRFYVGPNNYASEKMANRCKSTRLVDQAQFRSSLLKIEYPGFFRDFAVNPLHDAISPNSAGRIAVPQGPGLGIDPDPAVIAKLRVS